MSYGILANDLTLIASAATDFIISGFSGNVLFDGVPLQIDNFEGEAIRLQGNTNGNTLDTYIGFHRADGSVAGTIGVDSTGTNAIRIVGTEDGVEIIGSDALPKFDTVNGTLARLYNSSGQEALRTHTVSSSFSTRLRVLTDVSTQSVGFNETPQVNISSGGTYDVDIDDIGRFLRKSTSSSVTIAFDAFVCPTGSTVLVNNDNSGTCTISSPSMTLEWVDGSGGAAPTGNRTLARNSVATVRKKSGSVWQIWGNGIS
jgi:hypothetical protein